MKNYKARLQASEDERFDHITINLRTNAGVHKNTKLSYIEPLDVNADAKEVLWYENVVKNNVLEEE